MMVPMNLRTKVEAWMTNHPSFVEIGAGLFLGCIGLSLGAGMGIWFQDLLHGIVAAVILGGLGFIIGYHLVQLALAPLVLILIIVFPSRVLYPAIASVGGVLGACINGVRDGFSVESAIVDFIVYGILLLILCEITGGLWSRVRPLFSSSKEDRKRSTTDGQ